MQSGADDLLGRDVIDEEEQPGAESFDGGEGLGELALGLDQLLDPRGVDGLEQGLAVGEVAVKGSGADASGFGDVVEGGIGTVTGEGLFGDREDAFAIALRVDAGLAGDWFCSLYGHVEEIATGDTLRLSIQIRRHSPYLL